MSKIIILENNGGRLANQLWQYAVIYAFCLENGYEVENYAFFRYHNLFNTPAPKNRLVYGLFFKLYAIHRNIKLNKILYNLYSFIVKKFALSKIFSPNRLVHLTAVDGLQSELPETMADLRRSNNKTLYICGWNFRNPAGLIKYHSKIHEFFKPKQELVADVEATVDELRAKYGKIVGIHVRHGDYAIFENGQYYFSFEDVRKIIDNFLDCQTEPERICFIICSDAEIDTHAFEGLNYLAGFGSPIKDLYALSLTDLIISSTSTFSQWASYYGNINNINFSKEKINWNDCFAQNNKNNPWLV